MIGARVRSERTRSFLSAARPAASISVARKSPVPSQFFRGAGVNGVALDGAGRVPLDPIRSCCRKTAASGRRKSQSLAPPRPRRYADDSQPAAPFTVASGRWHGLSQKHCPRTSPRQVESPLFCIISPLDSFGSGGVFPKPLGLPFGERSTGVRSARWRGLRSTPHTARQSAAPLDVPPLAGRQ